MAFALKPAELGYPREEACHGAVDVRGRRGVRRLREEEGQRVVADLDVRERLVVPVIGHQRRQRVACHNLRDRRMRVVEEMLQLLQPLGSREPGPRFGVHSLRERRLVQFGKVDGVLQRESELLRVEAVLVRRCWILQPIQHDLEVPLLCHVHAPPQP